MTMLSHFAAAGGAVPVYIEDIFSTYLYTGNGSTQTITNGIDLAGKGGLVWSKETSFAVGHVLYDTARGPYPTAAYLASNLTDAESLSNAASFANITSFNSNGYSIGSTSSTNIINFSGSPFISWTFRKQPKFFDVVTWTGNGANRTIAHNLESDPGCIIVKRTDATNNWQVYHRGLTSAANSTQLNLTNAQSAATTVWNSTAPTSTVFSVGTSADVNASGGAYVAYLFAHNAGGFGLSGTDNVISCGSYTGNGSTTGPVVSLGYEPQWLMIKNASGTGGWQIIDNMRGMPVGSADVVLQANTNAGGSSVDYVSPTATGFQIVSTSSEVNTNASTYIYIAIRRGPMKTPTSGTSVFAPSAVSADNTTISTGFPVDMFLENLRTGSAANTMAMDRLRGSTVRLTTSSTNAESGSGSGAFVFDDNTGYQPDFFVNGSIVSYAFRRAPGFFDQIVYTGTAANTTVPHGLTVVPEMMIFKARQSATNWAVYHKDVGATKALYLNQNVAPVTNSVFFNNTAPTASVVSLGSSSTTNSNFATNEMLCYLFASCPGVSKVGSYTGTGATQVIDCGFTSGARFVLIKATSATGNWYVWDTARGIVAGNDPYLLLNSTGAEVTTTDWVDAAASGFELSNAAGNLANSSGVSYIFLAIA